MTVSAWLHALKPPFDEPVRRSLAGIYGNQEDVLPPRAALIRKVLECFLARFGDLPVRIFRAPGRINLRGMHVDTHGGYLNLMTHQREMVLVLAHAKGTSFHFVNIDPAFGEIAFDLSEAAAPVDRSWMHFITSAETTRQVNAHKGEWRNYLLGAVTRAQRALPDGVCGGMCGAAGSDLPRGAALSSSHALCLAALQGTLRMHGGDLDPAQLILAVRDAEWYTGARTGVSDQGAMILGRRGMMINAALFAEDLDLTEMRRIPFPDALRVLVINSHTQRSLSGAQLAAYTGNRFAYSMALAILRQELRAMDIPPATVSEMDRLARIDVEVMGGIRGIAQLLRRIPVCLTPKELRERYPMDDFDAVYERYFGGVPEPERPRTINLRGPLLFGLAESERARLFPGAIASGDYALAGHLMRIGHDGDRVVDASSHPFRRDVDDAALSAMEKGSKPLALWPGNYGASSPVLDALVDAAIGAGALGASLTGAGIAGAVLALCRTEDANRIANTVREMMAGKTYAALAQRNGGLNAEELAEAVMVNNAPDSAGELTLNGAPNDL